jgi:conjugal transfer/entry exclusion protein
MTGPSGSAHTVLHKENHSMTVHWFFRPARKTRPLAAAALAVLGCLLTPPAAQAQFGLFGSGLVFDPSNFARNVLHYARRLEQMNMQRQELQQGLAYSLRAIDREFQRTFPGTRVFQNYPVERQAQATRTLATLRGALNAVNRAAREFPTSVARLDAMKRQLGSIQGHEEALELNGTIGMYSAEELTLLRQAVSALTNVQTVYYADEVNAQAQEAATVRARLTAMSAPGPRYRPFSLRVTP